ncbi:MAG: thermonuclease family protein [Campylobacterales bacterium]|nr:thermonuclease family protein [Campylobacterales bacterium]
MKKYLLTIIFCGVQFVYGLSSTQITGKVVGVMDGDTIKVLTIHKDLYKIRLANIDAPEKRQSYGQKSKWYLSDLIYGKFVLVRISKKDRYGRYIGTVYLNRENINLKMVEHGYAWAYRKYLNDRSFITYENYAKNNHLGLWADQDPLPPEEFRKLHR